MATPRSTRDPLFLGRWFQDEVIIVAVRWYLTYPLSYRQICGMLHDRGISIAPSTVALGDPLCAGFRKALAAIREASGAELALR